MIIIAEQGTRRKRGVGGDLGDYKMSPGYYSFAEDAHLGGMV
jgi:hypothetical protein